MISHEDAATHTVDAFSVAVVVGTLMNILPSVAALFTIVWTAIRIFETRTIQRLMGRGEENSREEDA